MGLALPWTLAASPSTGSGANAAPAGVGDDGKAVDFKESAEPGQQAVRVCWSRSSSNEPVTYLP